MFEQVTAEQVVRETPAMTRRQVSRYLNCSERTISRLVKRGELPCVRVGRQMRFDLPEVRAALRRQISRPSSDSKSNIFSNTVGSANAAENPMIPNR